MKFHTRTLSSGSLTIATVDGVMSLTLQANSSSSCNVIGAYTFQDVPSAPILLSSGEGLTLNADSPSSPIDGVTIEWQSGTIDIVIGI